jgi:hypothetical protein
MKRVVLAAAILSTLAAAPAAAQYYRPYGGQEEFDDDGFDRRRPPPPYSYRERYDYPRSRRARLGSVCITSRGNCDVGGAVPLNAPCRCYIPGFGPKRGNVGY